MLLLFVVDQFKYPVKRLELFKIRRYIKCPLLLLLSQPNTETCQSATVSAIVTRPLEIKRSPGTKPVIVTPLAVNNRFP